MTKVLCAIFLLLTMSAAHAQPPNRPPIGKSAPTQELASRQDELNFHLVAVSVDGTRLSEFARRTGGSVPFPVLLDAGGRVSARCRVHHVPTVVILGPDGIVRFTACGYPGNSVVLRELRKIAPGE